MRGREAYLGHSCRSVRMAADSSPRTMLIFTYLAPEMEASKGVESVLRPISGEV